MYPFSYLYSVLCDDSWIVWWLLNCYFPIGTPCAIESARFLQNPCKFQYPLNCNCVTVGEINSNLRIHHTFESFPEMRHVHNTTSWHDSGMINSNLIWISTVREGKVQTKICCTNPKGLGTNSNLRRNARLDLQLLPTGDDFLKYVIWWFLNRHFPLGTPCAMLSANMYSKSMQFLTAAEW